MFGRSEVESATERVFLFCFSCEPWVNSTTTNTSEWQALQRSWSLLHYFFHWADTCLYVVKLHFHWQSISDCHRPSQSHIMWSLILGTEGRTWFSVRRQWGVALQGFPSSVLCSLEQGLALQPDVTVLLPCADPSPPPLLGFLLLPGHRMTTEGAGDSYLHLSITLNRIVNAFQG